MKKLLIAAVVICAAAVTQASAFDWKVSTMNKAYVAGSTTDLYSGTVYLFCADTYSQSTLLDAGKTFDTSKAVATSAMASGVLSGNSPTATTKSFDYGADGDNNKFYMAIIAGDNIYVSANVTAIGTQGKSTPISISAANSKLAATSWTKGSTFATAGWYTAAPEPTSGLMLLIGVGLMALRRRKA